MREGTHDLQVRSTFDPPEALRAQRGTGRGFESRQPYQEQAPPCGVPVFGIDERKGTHDLQVRSTFNPPEALRAQRGTGRGFESRQPYHVKTRPQGHVAAKAPPHRPATLFFLSKSEVSCGTSDLVYTGDFEPVMNTRTRNRHPRKGVPVLCMGSKGFEPSGSEWSAGGAPEPRGGPPAGGIRKCLKIHAGSTRAWYFRILPCFLPKTNPSPRKWEYNKI